MVYFGCEADFRCGHRVRLGEEQFQMERAARVRGIRGAFNGHAEIACIVFIWNRGDTFKRIRKKSPGLLHTFEIETWVSTIIIIEILRNKYVW